MLISPGALLAGSGVKRDCHRAGHRCRYCGDAACGQGVPSAGGDHRRNGADLPAGGRAGDCRAAIGFGQEPAIIALILYGVLPILQGTLAGIAAVPASVLSVAEGMGMSAWQRLLKVELPLAAPVIIAGVRTSVIINIGTATIASTVGVNTLGTPIIIGLSGFNTAYIIQGRFWLRWRRLWWIACLNAWPDTSANTAANNKRVTCKHNATDTADGHQCKKGNYGQFRCLHHVLLLLTEQLYGEAQLLMNH